VKQILIVNLFLGPKRKARFNRLVVRIKELGTTVSTLNQEELPNMDQVLLARYDGLILSGTEALFTRTSDRQQFDEFLRFLPKIEVPTLGICGGHQALAIAYGGEVAKSNRHITGFRTVELEDKDHLLAGLPAKIRVMQSHYEEVKHLPAGFVRIAKSRETKNEGMKHEQKPVYGIQAHPERWSGENLAGKRILENFIERIAVKP
jgi:GMP synthase (glutamine-hydrolysing)